jgi:hypothetical protein
MERLYNWSHDQLKSKSPTIVETKLFSSIQRNTIFPFYKTSSLALTCTHKYEIIPFYNTLMTNLSITYISFACLCLISWFLYNFSKSRLFISHICFHFKVQGHLAFKLTHAARTTSDLDDLYMHEKIRDNLSNTTGIMVN